jgi:anti-sigma regulatory factor (Ser/Thr protein kinase)
MAMRFTDEGSPFDPTDGRHSFEPREAIRNRLRHGIGLTMIRRLVDSIEYERVGDKFNVVTLKKTLDHSRRVDGCSLKRS